MSVGSPRWEGIVVDPPVTHGHGRLWSHVASDRSLVDLHAFAASLGIPSRGFDRDHYDVPAEWYDAVVAAGARPVSSRELVRLLIAAGLRRPKASTLAPRRPGRPLLRPRRLGTGDRVAVVLTAGPVAPERLAAGLAVLRSWGLDPVLPDAGGDVLEADVLEAGVPAWLAASDEVRSARLAHAWTRPDIRAVWAARGGYGTQRILDLLDWDDLARATPRVLVGFSDVTALHQAVAARLGVVSLHGPGVAWLGRGDASTVEATRLQLMEPGPVVLRGSPGLAGIAEGVLVGGNVTLLASSAGTSHIHPATGGIAVLEDVGEAPYRLDRSLTQLLRSGWFEGVHGIALGTFVGCGEPADVRRLLLDRLAPLGVPLVLDVPFGHGPVNTPLPLGVRARLDGDAGTLEASAGLR